jgi:cytochrome c oxidase subunit 2
MKIHTYEKIFLSLGAGMLVAFIGALAYATLGMGIHLPGPAGTIDPAKVMQTPPFNTPGVKQTGPNQYEVVMVGYTWGYLPPEIRVPHGADITFIATSMDVIHGFELEGTRINMMLIPGRISRNTYRFDKPGEHLLICHEYCGIGHQTMHAKVIVE